MLIALLPYIHIYTTTFSLANWMCVLLLVFSLCFFFSGFDRCRIDSNLRVSDSRVSSGSHARWFVRWIIHHSKLSLWGPIRVSGLADPCLVWFPRNHSFDNSTCFGVWLACPQRLPWVEFAVPFFFYFYNFPFNIMMLSCLRWQLLMRFVSRSDFCFWFMRHALIFFWVLPGNARPGWSFSFSLSVWWAEGYYNPR